MNMRSIKPGRGPSAMNALGSIVGIIFGTGWTILAYEITRFLPIPLVGIIFPLFGVCVTAICVVQLLFHLKNAVSKDRMSIADMTGNEEERDPLNQLFGRTSSGKIVAPESIENRLKRLEELKLSEVISAEEYESHRRRILSET